MDGWLLSTGWTGVCEIPQIMRGLLLRDERRVTSQTLGIRKQPNPTISLFSIVASRFFSQWSMHFIFLLWTFFETCPCKGVFI